MMIISLKRFKFGGRSQRYGMMSMFGGGFGGGEKIDSEVDFPLEGLDMSKHVIGP